MRLTRTREAPAPGRPLDTRGARAAYLCDVTIDSTAPQVGRTSKTSTLRLRKSGDGWVLLARP